MSEYVRITWSVSGPANTTWTRDVTVRDQFIDFVCLKSGHRRYVSHATSYSMAEVDSVPPRVQEAMNDA